MSINSGLQHPWVWGPAQLLTAGHPCIALQSLLIKTGWQACNDGSSLVVQWPVSAEWVAVMINITEVFSFGLSLIPLAIPADGASLRGGFLSFLSSSSTLLPSKTGRSFLSSLAGCSHLSPLRVSNVPIHLQFAREAVGFCCLAG